MVNRQALAHRVYSMFYTNPLVLNCEIDGLGGFALEIAVINPVEALRWFIYRSGTVNLAAALALIYN